MINLKTWFTRNRGKLRPDGDVRGDGTGAGRKPAPAETDEFWLRAPDSLVTDRLRQGWDSWPESTRGSVAALLEQSGYVHRLLHVLQGGNGDDRLEAAELLGILRVTRASMALFESLSDRDEALSLEATRALIRIHNPLIIKLLIQALEQPLRRPPARVADVLIGLGNETVQPLLDYLPLLSEEACCLALDILGQLGDDRAVPVLIEMASGANASIRLSAIRALGELRARQAEPCLRQALDDRDQRVRAAAGQVLGRLGFPALN